MFPLVLYNCKTIPSFALLVYIVYCNENRLNFNITPYGKSVYKLEFVFYVKTDVSHYWSDAVLYRKSGFGTANSESK